MVMIVMKIFIKRQLIAILVANVLKVFEFVWKSIVFLFLNYKLCDLFCFDLNIELK